jgi:DNA repair protein RadC
MTNTGHAIAGLVQTSHDETNSKLGRLGAEALSDKELLALMLGGGRATARTVRDAERLTAFKLGPAGAGYSSLVREHGIDARTAAAVAVSVEYGKRHSGRPDGRPVLDSPNAIMQHVPMAIRSARKEHFFAFYLNARSQLLHFDGSISVGTLSASLCHPREIFFPAIAHSSAALVIGHNLCDASHKLCNVKSNIM